MELRHIRYFLAVAEEKNFTRAAARVGIGQPPMSQQIRDLEAELGVQLFRRVATGAELTEAGQAFYAAVRTLPDQAGAAVRQAQRAARGETGVLRLGFTGAASLNPLVPSAVRAFRRAYPDVQLLLTEGHSALLAAGLRDSTLDVAFLRPAVSLDGLKGHPLPDEVMVAVLPQSHPAARQAAVDLSVLRDEPFILTPRSAGPTVYDAVIEACRLRGFDPVIGQSAPQISSVVALVSAELGVSIVPQSMRQLAMAGVVYRDIAGVAPVARLSLVTPRAVPPLVSNFLATVADEHP